MHALLKTVNDNLQWGLTESIEGEIIVDYVFGSGQRTHYNMERREVTGCAQPTSFWSLKAC